MKQLSIILAFLTFACGSLLRAQGVYDKKDKYASYFGIVAAPVIPTNFLGTKTTVFSDPTGQMTTTFDQKTGFTFGGVVRIGLTKRFSIETGLSQIRRTYEVTHSIPDSSVYAQKKFSLVSYDIPLNGLVYIQATENTFMSAALGVSVSHYPSDIQDTIRYSNDFGLVQQGRRTERTYFSLNAGIGYEWRTEKAGTFYIGGSAKVPFKPIMFGFGILTRYSSSNKLAAYAPVDGNFLSVELRYFLPALKIKDPEFKGGPIE
jgi:hypothetical protein